MSPDRVEGPAFRAVGGEVVSRAGRGLATAPLDLLRRLGREAMARRAGGDLAAARSCAFMAADLALAITEACDWRRAAGATAAPCPELSETVRLTRELKACRHR